MAKIRRLNMDAIRSSLEVTQHNFKKINSTLTIKRKPPSDEVIDNLLAGYAKIDAYLENGTDLFGMGNSHLILELNHIVLYHNSAISIEEDKSQFKATQLHFYDGKDGGIGQLMDWLSLNKNTKIWKKTAGVFTHIISQPQLFLEGNHRTASLIMSYLLIKEGLSPFVLSYENAKHFFEPAELIKKRRKKTLIDEYIHLPKQTRLFAKLLQNEQTQKFFVND
ncbi:hypothetical protein LCGC14_1347390 [marine sediment metagenome]|uniref:Fido domain-containing protein n=1 Tax=marine sediment metagenome TaxID=412755 RepID=A0A0F9MSM2_9ZZZZ|nr:hypothetical protein [Methylophaga sp.]HEC60452.1 hypothetical protein [Methylophaga sp.]